MTKENDMATIKELRAQMARIATEARSKFDEIKDDTPEARAAEINGEFDRMMADHDRLRDQAERLQKLDDIESRLREGDPARRPVPKGGEQRGADDGDGNPEYRNVFWKILSGDRVADISAEERAVLRQGATKFEQRAQMAGSTTAGGYTVPTELMAQINIAMKAWGPMYDETICTVITTMGGNSIKLPTVDDTSVTAIAHTEGAALIDTGVKDVTFGQKSLDSYGFDTEFVRWSWELETDSIFSMEQLLSQLLGERLGRIANLQLTTGTGASAPNGIVTAAGLGKTAAGTAAITLDEVIDLIHSIDPAYRMSPKFRTMFNDSILQYLRKIKDGDGNYIVRDAPDGSGRLVVGSVSAPYSINQAMASLGTGNRVMVAGDFSRYYVRKVGAPVIGVVNERFWPDRGVAGLIRFDGELATSSAVKYLACA
jgi:HK97 family phage major capsid protein